MRVPRRLKIGARRFRVVWYGVLQQDGRDLWGECRHGDDEISLNRSLAQSAPSNVTAAVIHEALHALDAEYDTRLSESQVLRLSSALAAFLLDNKFCEPMTE